MRPKTATAPPPKTLDPQVTGIDSRRAFCLLLKTPPDRRPSHCTEPDHSVRVRPARPGWACTRRLECHDHGDLFCLTSLGHDALALEWRRTLLRTALGDSPVAQVISYLGAFDRPLGLLITFSVT